MWLSSVAHGLWTKRRHARAGQFASSFQHHGSPRYWASPEGLARKLLNDNEMRMLTANTYWDLTVGHAPLCFSWHFTCIHLILQRTTLSQYHYHPHFYKWRKCGYLHRPEVTQWLNANPSIGTQAAWLLCHACDQGTSRPLLKRSTLTTAIMLAIHSPWWRNKTHWATWLSDRTNFLQLMSQSTRFIQRYANHPRWSTSYSYSHCQRGHAQTSQRVLQHHTTPERKHNGKPSVRI